MERRESLKKDMKDQELEHLHWLQSLGFQVEQLSFGKWIKCSGKDELRPSGAFAYRTWANQLQSGGTALFTQAKVHGEEYEYKTLPGKPNDEKSFFRLSPIQEPKIVAGPPPEAITAIKSRWDKAAAVGESTYLKRKGVYAYGLRFYNTREYGANAIVPIRTIEGRLVGLQWLNEYGPKRFEKGSNYKGAFHLIGQIKLDSRLIIVEGYATGAFLYHLLNLTVCVAFTAHNLLPVAQVLRAAYPNLSLIFAADNDRHLSKNEGVEAARTAAATVVGQVVVPDFGMILPAKDATDWLDLARLLGNEIAVAQLNGT